MTYFDLFRARLDIITSLGHYYNSIAKLTISMQAAFDCDTNLVIKIC